MIKKLVLFTLCLFSTQAPAAGFEDVTGFELQVPKTQPQRIVTLAPSLAELVADFLGPDLKPLVGVSDFSDYPTVVTKIERVGSYANFNLEKVVALKPDLVLATTDGNPKEKVLRLRELGLKVLVVSTDSFDEIRRSMSWVGQMLGRPEQAAQMVAQLDRGIEHIKNATKPKIPLRVIIQVGEDPLVVVGGLGFLNEALKLVGATNVYGDIRQKYPRPAFEDALSRKPDLVLVLQTGSDAQGADQMARRWKEIGKSAPVPTVKPLKTDAILRPSLRILEGLSILQQAVYPKDHS